jgi:hypothetical protein
MLLISALRFWDKYSVPQAESNLVNLGLCAESELSFHVTSLV